MLEALRDPQATEWADKDGGYVSITKLLRYYPDLQRETFGSTRVIAHAVEGQATKAVRLDKARRRVRLQSIREMILERAEAVLEAAPRGVVPLRAILEAPPLREALAGLADPVQEARQALEHEESPGVVRGEFVQRHPKGARLRRRVEESCSRTRAWRWTPGSGPRSRSPPPARCPSCGSARGTPRASSAEPIRAQLVWRCPGPSSTRR
ncbi:unnamed protein product [Prorocentrum cordatum]|uniref:2'-phosphotransferase n=1 Tax=Prorocentrum cordatum TaxID=2364126 RepID=A0ABN9S402_9DINO|nr:unnamed protein product [Polarella glacialis]